MSRLLRLDRQVAVDPAEGNVGCRYGRRCLTGDDDLAGNDLDEGGSATQVRWHDLSVVLAFAAYVLSPKGGRSGSW